MRDYYIYRIAKTHGLNEDAVEAWAASKTLPELATFCNPETNDQLLKEILTQ